jgi:hypothetical protein
MMLAVVAALTMYVDFLQPLSRKSRSGVIFPKNVLIYRKHTVFAWKNDQPLIQFVHQKDMELIPNKLFLTDGKLLYFIVDTNGKVEVLEAVKRRMTTK